MQHTNRFLFPILIAAGIALCSAVYVADRYFGTYLDSFAIGPNDIYDTHRKWNREVIKRHVFMNEHGGQAWGPIVDGKPHGEWTFITPYGDVIRKRYGER